MKKIILFLVSAIFLISIVSALDANISISIPKTEYTPNEIIQSQITISANENISGIFSIDVVSAEKGVYSQESLSETLNLSVQETKKATYPIKITETMPPGKYILSARILDNLGNIMKEKQKYFYINETPKTMNVKILTCKDWGCSKKSKIFVLGERIYLEYESDTSEIKLNGYLIYPNQTMKSLTLPAVLYLDQIGTYQINLIASKENYRNLPILSQFGIIEKEADIQFKGVCNIDGSCSGKETAQNCPQDCRSATSTLTWITIAIIILIFIIGAIIVYRKLTKRTENEIIS